MHEGSQYLDVVLFAMVAVFLALRLRSVLGRRTGNEKPPPSVQSTRTGPTVGRVIDVAPVSRPAAPDLPVTVAPVLADIARADPSFVAERFLAGAQSAFDMILRAFVAGDEGTLRRFLSDQVYRPFAEAIEVRHAAGHECANVLEDIRSAEIVEAALDGSEAHITVRFVSHQRVGTRDAAGQVIEGDLSRSVELTDLWTFSRDLHSHDPNWLLTATRTPEE